MRFIGKYKILGLLGRGGMARVYKVFDPDNDQLLSLKLLWPQPILSSLLGQEEITRRFLAEAKTMQALEHPNIARVIAWGQDCDLTYMVQEYLCLNLSLLLGEDREIELPSRPISPLKARNCSVCSSPGETWRKYVPRPWSSLKASTESGAQISRPNPRAGFWISNKARPWSRTSCAGSRSSRSGTPKDSPFANFICFGSDMHEQGLKSQAQSIFMAGIKAVDPADCVHTCLHMDRDRLQIKDSTIFLNRINRLIVVGMGKASAAMAAAVESLLGEKIDDGLIITKYGHKVPLQHCRVVEAAHPVPDTQGVAAADALINLVSTAGPDDVVLCLISGGGSALSPAPIQGLSLEDKQAVTWLLLACGATIQEINTVRKHLSRLKGGGLCRLAPKARVVSLTLSDVIGDDLDIIASGATVPDTGTFKDCMQIVQSYNLLSQLPHSVRDHLQQGCSGRIQETPKPGDAVFENTANHIVGSLGQALGAAEEKARSLGFQSLILTSTLKCYGYADPIGGKVDP